jgi:hypothetical protein
VILAPVALLLQITVPKQPLAINVALAPLHKLLLFVLICGVPGVLPVLITTELDTTLSPQVLLQVAVYVPEAFTVMLVPVAVVLQVTVPVQLVAVKVAVSLLHRLNLLLAMVGAFGLLPVVIVAMFDALLLPQLLLHVAL